MVAVESRCKFFAPSGADDAIENRRRASGARLAERHDDPGDDEGGQEQEHRAADAGHHRQRVLGQVAELRLQALDDSRQIRVGLRPCTMDLLADDRPLGHARRGCGNLQGVVLHAADEVMNGIAERAHQHRRRHDDQHDAGEYQQRGGEPLLPHSVRELLMDRIERHGQDQRPRHQDRKGEKTW